VSNYPENKWELYDIVNDRTESKNLAKENPEVIEKLNIAYQKWAKANDVVEWNDNLASKAGFVKK
jgi:arylsulfatase